MTAGELGAVEAFIVGERADLAGFVILGDADLEIGIEIGEAGLGKFAGAVFVAHLAVEAFETAREFGDVEQGACVAVGDEASADDFEFALPCPGQMDGAGDKIFGRFGDEIRHAGGAQKASADAAGEAAARPCQHGHAHPERIGRSRVGAIGRAIEEQVCERVARKVAWIGQFGRENQTITRDAARLGLLAQALVGFGRVVEQPEDAVLGGGKDVHPAIESKARICGWR